MRACERVVIGVVLMLAGSAAALGQAQYEWRYYRPGNTGIQGDYCDALWIGADGDPWIGGYDASFEEGGLSKFVRSENRWINVSNVDYPEIGHPENTGTTRVRDITADAQGNLWMGTGRGVLRFNPAVGPSSLKRYDASNSPWPGGWVTNIEVAPDGTVWASGYATVWGGGGLMRFNPATQAWTFLGTSRPERLAIQPRAGGGYYVWAADAPGSIGQTQRYNSLTQTWTTIPSAAGNPRNLPGTKCVDPAGNMWVHRVLANGFDAVMDCLRPNGTWVGVSVPPGGGGSVTTAYAPMRALTDGNGQVWKFDGASWTGLGDWGNINWTYDLAIDGAGVVWASGVGGAARRDPGTGQWQRYRVTNTSQYDSFNDDLALGADGSVYACANAGPGVGGMVRFDGTRWTGFNNLTYGLGINWPFPTDNSNAVLVRSDGTVVVNPMFNGTRVWNGSTWSVLPGGASKVIGYVEDSLGRTWGLGEYFNLGLYQGGTFNNVGIASWGQRVRRDPSRAGTVWAQAGYELVRTDGTYRFSRTIDDYPQLTSQSDTFSGLAVGADGTAWVGASVMLGAGGTGGALIRVNPTTGTSQMMRYDLGWNLPGWFVSPMAVTPDGKVWMTYDTDFLTARRGLCWYDPTTGQVGDFPAPSGGEPQWGGLPHAQVEAMEVREVAGGYELWMTCISRGIAVLRVTQASCRPDLTATATVGAAGYGVPDGVLSSEDFFYYLQQYAAGNTAVCDLTGSAAPGSPGYGVPNGVINSEDFFYYLALYAAGC